MRDSACASVELFSPTAGAPGLLALGFAIAGVLALGFAGGAVCAKAPSARSAPVRSAITAVAKSHFMNHFLDLLHYPAAQQIFGMVSSTRSEVRTTIVWGLFYDYGID